MPVQDKSVYPENARTRHKSIEISKLAVYFGTTKADICIMSSRADATTRERSDPLDITDLHAIADQLCDIERFSGILLFNAYYMQSDEYLKLEAKVRHCFSFTSLISSHAQGRDGQIQIFGSNSYWFCGKTLGRFERWTSISSELVGNVHQDSRRYFFSSVSIVKQYILFGRKSMIQQRNLESYRREVTFFRCKPPALSPCQELIDHQASEAEASIAFRPIQGETLLDIILSGSDYDHKHIILGVLKQLALLEKHSLYYDDLRPWNVVLSEDGCPGLIDYGAISKSRRDVSLPSNIYMSFLCFVRDVAIGRPSVLMRSHVRTISPYGLPDPYRYWAVQLWKTPISHWTFEKLYSTLMNLEPAAKTLSTDASFEWMRSVDEALTRSERAQNPARAISRH